MNLGADNLGGSYWDGTIAEVVFVGSILSQSDREKMEGYLAWKWGIQGNLPLDHPYKNSAPGIGGSVTNLSPTAITENQATLNAAFNATGTNYVVNCYWGASDGGTNPSSWTSSAIVGTYTNLPATLSQSITGLVPGQSYYYTFRASNGSNDFWASPSWHFTTPGTAAITENHAVPLGWLSNQNAAWSSDYEAAALADPDGDGIPTWQEYWSGTDPMDSNSFLKIDTVEFDGTTVVLKWQHEKIATALPAIKVESTTDLSIGTWLPVGQMVPTNGLNTWSGAVSASPQLFFRLALTTGP